MALDALTIATQGLLSTPPEIALQGLLDAFIPPPPPPPPTPSMGGGGGGGGAGGNMLGRGKYYRPPTRAAGKLRLPWEKPEKPVAHKPIIEDDDDDEAIAMLLLDD